MTDRATAAAAQYISDKGIKISAIAKATKIPDGILRRSLATRERALRSDEYLEVCNFLGKNPFDFYQAPEHSPSILAPQPRERAG
ncbi:hypothetical protein [Acutalibacter sp. 1XD8-36]|uniref:hypothetical protein n=1 Tax=Acutalibacter sp. 1XD8-36 TaxID=2320852 RepID=UPI0014132B05|nr:hypothetical protein [Acutalibacter sp. 1XD8-36]NBJ90987.1 hypothetical protein [Acutalibacter sp. 1XD8-36]